MCGGSAADALLGWHGMVVAARHPPASSQGQARIEVATELVQVNVVARDKSGNLVRDLKKEDFTLFEDGKKQAITSFDFENVDVAAGPTEATVSGAADSG